MDAVTPKVSVVMPVYNVKEYLPQALDCVLGQTLADFELICVDDGSTDGSLDILHSYAARDGRIRVLCQQNLYAGVARNNGMAAARGEYLLFLDSDDLFAPDLLERTCAAADAAWADVVLFGGKKYDDATGEYQDAPWYLRRAWLPRKKVFSRSDIPNRILTVSSPAPWNKLFRRAFVQAEGLQFQPLHNANDAFFTLMAVCLAGRIAAVDADLVFYRVGMQKNLQSTKKKNPTCFVQAYKAIYEELCRRGLFAQVEKSYVELTISGCAFNLASLDDDASRFAVYEAIADPEFLRSGLLDHPLRYYPDRKKYRLVRQCVPAWKQHCLLEQAGRDRHTRTILPARLEKTPRVSVVVPVYNVEAYLEACLDSVLGQTLSDIEVICVNDGSPDGSMEILRRYALQDARVCVLSQENGGLSSARNAGVRHASGEYLYFMDSDDILEPNALELAYGRASRDALDVLYFDGSSFSEDESCRAEAEQYSRYYSRRHEYAAVRTGAAMMRQMIANDEYRTSPCLQLTRRQYFLDRGLWFCEGLLHEDNPYTFCAMLGAQRTAHLRRALFRRRVRRGSIVTSRTTFAHVYGYFRSYLLMEDFLRAMPVTEGTQAALDEMRRVMRSAREKYTHLSPEERAAYKGLALYEMNLFGVYIDDVDESEKYWGGEGRLGRGFFWLMRKWNGGMQCLSDNGWKYTVLHLWEKVRGRLH